MTAVKVYLKDTESPMLNWVTVLQCETMEASNLSFIADPPENPMQLFASWHNEALQYSDPDLFTDAMTIANISEWVKSVYYFPDFRSSVNWNLIFEKKKLKKIDFSPDALLNRNVMLRMHDQNGFIFVTERNTKKYKDFVRIDDNHLTIVIKES